MQVNNSLTKQDNKKTGFSNFLTNPNTKQRIWEVVGKDSQKFMTSILSAVTNNPTLQECDQMSVLNCAFLGQALNLVPSPQLGQYYMVPFKNKKKGTIEAQFQLGYKGYIQLMKRSGIYKKITVLSIKEGELIKYDPLEEEIKVNLIEDDEIREETPTVGYYAMFEEKNGFKKAIYWSKKKMLAHADKYSQAFSKEAYKRLLAGEIPQEDMWKYSSFWYKDFDGMAYKTMLRQLISKWGTMSIDTQEMQEAYTKDMAVLDDQGNPYFIENDKDVEEPSKPDIIVEPEPTTTVADVAEPEKQQAETPTETLDKQKRTRATKAKSEPDPSPTLQKSEDIENLFFN